ncbi:hypothetical protein JCM10212_006621 [Sporobolomyces blumeae]
MASKPSTSSAPLSDKRLYVGNLATTVDEYSLMQVCAKYGKIAKLDYLFHKTGPQRGKPRGYAFVEYGTSEEAKRAISALHERVFRGRKLVVSLASEQAPTDMSSSLGGVRKGKRPVAPSEINRPTAISLLKGQGVSQAPTNHKIAALEAKLAAMQRKKDSDPSRTGSPASTSGAATPTGRDEGQEWLDSFLPRPELDEGTSAGTQAEASSSTEASGKGKEATTSTGGGQAKALNAGLAGLPARPYFESSEPPRKL